MGSNTTKLKKYVEKGDELNALELYNKTIDIRNKLNANTVINKDSLDTWMHVAAKNGMVKFLKLLLNQHEGNPKKLNKRRQNVLHKICEGTNDSIQLECINLVLSWTDKLTNDKIDVNDKDDVENTCLHYAAMKNLQECVTTLLSNGAYLFIENKNKLTPCDLAERNGQKDMALLLESKMIFSNHEDKDDIEPEIMLIEEKNYGLRVQDLQEKKDKLLVETSDMLQCSLFEAELLLKKHSWSKEDLLTSWFDDPIKCYEKCGIINTSENTIYKAPSSSSANSDINKITSKECSICLVDYLSDENYDLNPQCGHKFCKSCWKNYLTIKIEEGYTGEILCPYLGCYVIIPHEIIEKLISKETARKYLQFDIKAFVESNPSIKWCPYPGCTMAINDPFVNENRKLRANSNNSRNDVKNRDFSKSVDCGSGHYSCWDCLHEGHEPATCQNWKDWFEKIKDIKPEELYNTNVKEELSANYLWLVTNSKKCPNQNCNAPIQKNEGCNHMKCSKCKHDFCWVCMEPWKKHSSATGGYFQCNRYEVLNKVLQSEKDRIGEAEDTHNKISEMNRFVHYYSRFKNHEHSYKLEEPLLIAAKPKYELLTAQLNKINQNENNLKLSQPNLLLNSDSITLVIDEKDNKVTSSSSTLSISTGDGKKYDDDLFIEDAIRELLKSRRILRASYVYGYYLDTTVGHKKLIFEFIQTEFEECTENLSQIIARPYLKTPKNKIIKTTKLLKRKRIEFLETISEGLILPDTPPSFKKYSKKRWKYLLKDDSQDDDELKNAVAISIKDLNPRDPWIVDKKGRHTNLIALLNDMPDLESDLDAIFIPSKNQGVCSKSDCNKPKAINTLTGLLLNYCSIKCMKLDRESCLQRGRQLSNTSQQDNMMISSSLSNRQRNKKSNNNSQTDLSSLLFDDKTFYSDLEKAIELSKKQDINVIKRISKLKQQFNSFADTDTDFDDSDSVAAFNHANSFDKSNSQDLMIQDDLQLAIQLSLQAYNNEIDKNNAASASAVDNNNHNQNEKTISNSKQYKLLPFNPIYVANKNDLSTLFKNMNDIIDDDDDDDDSMLSVDNLDDTLKNSSKNKKIKSFELKSKNLFQNKNHDNQKLDVASNDVTVETSNKDKTNQSLRI